MAPAKSLHDSNRFEMNVVQALGKLTEVFRLLLWEKSKEFGLSPIQILFMIYLRNQKPEMRRIGMLAREFNLTKATVSDAIRVLELKKLVERSQDTGDARSQTLHLTVEGVLRTRVLRNFARPLLVQFRKMTPNERVSFYMSILHLVNFMGADGFINPARMCLNCGHLLKSDERQHCRYLDIPIEEPEYRFDCAYHSSVTGS